MPGSSSTSSPPRTPPLGHADILDRCRQAGAPVAVVSGQVMASIAQTVTPQGLAAVCRRVDVPLDDVLDASPGLVAILVNVRDPGNLGTVIRTADAAGADACPDRCLRGSVQREVRPGHRRPLPRADRARGPIEDVTGQIRAAGLAVLAADGAGNVDLDDALDAGTRTVRPRGCSVTRRGGCRATPGRQPTA